MLTNRLQNISSLNIIRALTALIVVVYHSKFILWCGGSVYLEKIGLNHWYDYPLFLMDLLSSNGEPIVVCFFILSGFVITHSYRKSSFSIFQFYSIRLVRIYIPFLAAILFSVLTLVLGHTYFKELFVENIREYNSRLIIAWENLNFESLLKTLIFQKNKEYIGLNFVYWSLLHEVIFYLVYPIYHYLKNKGRLFLFLVLLVMFTFTNNHLIYNQLYFLIGIFIYDLFDQNKTEFLPKNKFISISLIAFFYLLMTFSFIKHWKISADIFSALMSLFAFDFVLINIQKPNKYLMKLGDYSYTLYLNHLSILLLIYLLTFSLTNEFVNYNRFYYYFGTVISVVICRYLFFSEKISLKIIQNLKNKFKNNPQF